MNVALAAGLLLAVSQDRTVPPPSKGLPKAAAGVAVREVVPIHSPDSQPTRIAVHPKSKLLYVVFLNADLWEVDPRKNTKRLVLDGERYITPGKYDLIQCLGLHVDAEGRFYVVVNERHRREKPARAHVVVYRLTDGDGDLVPDRGAEWVSFDHPWGIGPFNHGACGIATGPDGLIYLGVGARTDHGEKGKDPGFDTCGETDLTAVMLRLDPRAERPSPEVYCKGLRNPYGFDWDDKGRLFAGEHGPNQNHPEELNWLRPGRHYGFPHRFGNHELPMYGDAVPAPDGLAFEKPVANLGPDARSGTGFTYTFAPHAAPCGMVFYRDGELPKEYHGTFLVTLFGNFLEKEAVGFNVVSMRVEEKFGQVVATTKSVLDQLRRPIDVCLLDGRLYVLEHTTYDDTRPCRVLEASASR